MSIYSTLDRLGIVLPNHAPVRAAFLPYHRHGETLVISGQLPVRAGKAVWTGSVPDQVSIDDAKHAARLCVDNILGWAHIATNGNLDRIAKVLRVGGFVVTSPLFTDAPSIINAASERFTQVFGEKGEHARIAIGVASLPMNTPVEVEVTMIVDL